MPMLLPTADVRDRQPLHERLPDRRRVGATVASANGSASANTRRCGWASLHKFLREPARRPGSPPPSQTVASARRHDSARGTPSHPARLVRFLACRWTVTNFTYLVNIGPVPFSCPFRSPFPFLSVPGEGLEVYPQRVTIRSAANGKYEAVSRRVRDPLLLHPLGYLP
jgi:hypothetical protein